MAGTFDHARHDQYRAALDTGRDRRRRARATLFRAAAACDRVGHLFSHHAFDYSLVAANFAP